MNNYFQFSRSKNTMRKNVFSVYKSIINFKTLEKMNLKNLNVQEMNKSEMKTIDGGFFGPFRAGLTLAYRQMWGLTISAKDFDIPMA